MALVEKNGSNTSVPSLQVRTVIWLPSALPSSMAWAALISRLRNTCDSLPSDAHTGGVSPSCLIRRARYLISLWAIVVADSMARRRSTADSSTFSTRENVPRPRVRTRMRWLPSSASVARSTASASAAGASAASSGPSRASTSGPTWARSSRRQRPTAAAIAGRSCASVSTLNIT